MTSPDTDKKPSSTQSPDPSNDATNKSGYMRGFAAAIRNVSLAKKVIRVIGETRPLAFASEGAVAGDALLPRWGYYGAWALSGLAVGADIYNKYDDAKVE